MSEHKRGPWAWRLRDLRGEPGPWHMAEHSRPAIAGGDNIEVIDVSEMAEEIKRLEMSAESYEASLAEGVHYVNQLEAQRDELLTELRDIEAIAETATVPSGTTFVIANKAQAAIAKATP